MKETGGKGSLAALIALKVVCCGALLLAIGAVSLGGILSLMDQPAVRFGGVALLVLTVGWLLRRVLASRSASPLQKSSGWAHQRRQDNA